MDSRADDAQKRAPGEHAIALTAEAASFLNDLEEHPLDPPREIKAVHFGENPRFDDAQKPVDLDELERLARAATPGPWKHDTDRDHDGIGWSYVRMPDDGARPRMDARHNDAAFIAAANPQAVLALIARLRALSGAVPDSYFQDLAEKAQALPDAMRVQPNRGDVPTNQAESIAPDNPYYPDAKPPLS